MTAAYGPVSPEGRLWGGRFTEAPAAAAWALGRSVHFDARLWPDDVAGSRAHAAAAGASVKRPPHSRPSGETGPSAAVIYSSPCLRAHTLVGRPHSFTKPSAWVWSKRSEAS